MAKKTEEEQTPKTTYFKLESINMSRSFFIDKEKKLYFQIHAKESGLTNPKADKDAPSQATMRYAYFTIGKITDKDPVILAKTPEQLYADTLTALTTVKVKSNDAEEEKKNKPQKVRTAWDKFIENPTEERANDLLLIIISDNKFKLIDDDDLDSATDELDRQIEEIKKKKAEIAKAKKAIATPKSESSEPDSTK